MLPFHHYSHVALLFAEYVYSVHICVLHTYLSTLYREPLALHGVKHMLVLN